VDDAVTETIRAANDVDFTRHEIASGNPWPLNSVIDLLEQYVGRAITRNIEPLPPGEPRYTRGPKGLNTIALPVGLRRQWDFFNNA